MDTISFAINFWSKVGYPSGAALAVARMHAAAPRLPLPESCTGECPAFYAAVGCCVSGSVFSTDTI